MGAKDVPDRKGSSSMGVISFILGLVGGTGSSIITKVLFTMQGEGVNGEMKPFEVSILLLVKGLLTGMHRVIVDFFFLTTFLYCVSPGLIDRDCPLLLVFTGRLRAPCNFRNLCF